MAGLEPGAGISVLAEDGSPLLVTILDIGHPPGSSNGRVPKPVHAEHAEEEGPADQPLVFFVVDSLTKARGRIITEGKEVPFGRHVGAIVVKHGRRGRCRYVG